MKKYRVMDESFAQPQLVSRGATANQAMIEAKSKYSTEKTSRTLRLERLNGLGYFQAVSTFETKSIRAFEKN